MAGCCQDARPARMLQVEMDTKLTIFSSLQNKDKPKKGVLPETIISGNQYYAAKTTGDVWCCYPVSTTLHLSTLITNSS